MNKESQFRKEFMDLYAEINLHSLLNKIVEKIRNFLNCEESSIFLYNPVRRELYFEIVTGERGEALKKIVLKSGEGVVGWIAEQDKGVFINDTQNDPRFTSVTDLKTDFKTRSIAGVPVRMDDKLLGVLEAVNKVEGAFNDEDLALLGYISNFIAIPLQNALLFKKITQETREKDRLIELAKIISSSIDLEEVFRTLKEIISEIIEVEAINVLVSSQERLYRLVGNPKQEIETRAVSETGISNNQAVFPLRTRHKSLGFLEIKAHKNIPEEIVSLIRGLAIFTAISIEKVDMVRQMIEKEKMEKELQIAKEIQRSFLLQEKVSINGLDVAYVNIPSSEVGGDYYDIVKLNEAETIFTINDISGHGIPASLIMSIFSANFTYRIKKDRNILLTVSHLNNLIAETTEANLYVTSFFCLIDTAERKLRYLNAGHVAPLVLRGKRAIELKEGATVLGMFLDVSRIEAHIQLKKNDLIVFFTDGIIEAENRNGEQYSLERLITFMQAHRELEAEVIKEKFVGVLREYVRGDAFDDDVTFMVVKVL